MWFALLMSCSSPPPPAVPPPKNALIILIDTLREDALHTARMPNVNGVGARGDVAFAWSAGTWTVPSVIALFTGRPVASHGWDLPTGRMGRYPKLPDSPTLPRVLHDAGFHTVGLYANPYLDEKLGFSDGFDVWKRSGDARMLQEFERALASTWKPDERNFAYVHLIGPHSPLRPSDESRERWGLDASWFADPKRPFEVGAPMRKEREGIEEAYRSGYYAVCEDTDALVGQLLDALGPYRDDTLVLITSDHGELLGEHGLFGHGVQVWEPLTRVPLVVEKGPPLPDRMGTASIAAYVGAALGVEHDWPTAVETPLLASVREGKLALTTDGQTKLIVNKGEFLYDLTADPGELSPREDAAAAASMQAQYEAWLPPKLRVGAETALDDKTVQEVRALGYVE